MGQIIFSEAGTTLGKRFGAAAVGRSLGALAGRALDGALAPAAEGPRLKELHVMEAREGAGVPSVYGRMRVGGQVIWAARFKETRTERSVSSKGGPKVAEYSYSVSFAVALCEGEITRVERAWANGEALDLSAVQHRVYRGDEAQLADPLIEAIEGAGCAPAYQGMAYIVFEDLPLDAFGARLPQLSFEITRVPPRVADAPGLGDVVKGVNIIPASGEFVYATEIVRERTFPGIERALNANSGEARADFLVSLDQLRDELPLVNSAALTVAWFGDDVQAGACRIRPGVETKERRTVPYEWSVAGVSRGDAYRVSQNESGHANYGGTPADTAVVQGIAEMKSRGLAVTLTPFLLMDTPGFPWRGRMTVSADGTAAARNEIEAFGAGDWGYRAFILHHASLAAEAGGVEAFLIGSEMRGLTRVRDEAGAFPFVEALVALAAEVKAILPLAKVSYAADWTEYGAYVPGDASGDVLFPLDALWVDANVDFVGIDWYPPMGDWRDGETHLDALAGYRGADDAAYLRAQLSGGEAYDWYYASEADRDAQVRTPILDTAHGEDWVFRKKDLNGWHGALHYERPGGVRAATPTGWMAGMKPVRLSEIGFAAVDKGGNAPNVFVDPKSVESFLPPYSDGSRDDVFQRAALGAVLPEIESGGVVEEALVWAWDGRPYPAFPARDDVWSDGPNWRTGHWLNGRSGLAPLADVVADICARGGVLGVDVSGLGGAVQGYTLDGVHGVRGALEALRVGYGFECVERDGALVFRMVGDGASFDVSGDELVEPGAVFTRGLLDKAPGRMRLSFADIDADYQVGVADAVREGADPRVSVDVALPLAMGRGRAEVLAARLLAEAAGAESGEASVNLCQIVMEPGDRLRVNNASEWRITDIQDAGTSRNLSLAVAPHPLAMVRAVEVAGPPPPVSVFGGIDLSVIDGPMLPGEAGASGPLVAAFGVPWPGAVRVMAGASDDALSERAVLERPAATGVLETALGEGPLGRWDYGWAVQVRVPAGGLSSASGGAVLNGANAALVETDAGWELLQFATAEFVAAETYELRGLLRGQQGSAIGAADVGARFVLLDSAVQRARVSPGEIGLELIWQVAGADESETLSYEAVSGLPWRVGHLRVRDGVARWTRRGADVPESWALPEAVNTGRFAVESDEGAGFGGRFEVNGAEAAVPVAALAVRVAEIGADGRVGPWVEAGVG